MADHDWDDYPDARRDSQVAGLRIEHRFPQAGFRLAGETYTKQPVVRVDDLDRIQTLTYDDPQLSSMYLLDLRLSG